MWHCFGCGAGGDVFSFIMRIENVNFMEAAQLLAERLGISFQWDRRESERGKLLEICEICAKYWNNVLLNRPEGEKGREYLLKRGLKMETIKEFMLGYAPTDIREILEILKKQGFTQEDLLKSGSFTKRDEGLHLIFAGRVIFPILSPEGKVIAFGGRALDDSQPKYINSSETLLFKKGRVLYGLHLAKKHIAERKTAILVEGYMDAISLYEAGVGNVVATLGTALTEDHLRILKRYANELFLAFDPDSPGMNAALRATPLLESAQLSAKVVQLPVGKDPDTYVKEEGREAFEALLEQAVDIYDFQIKKSLEKGEEGRREAIEIISKIEDPGKREAKSKKLAEELAGGRPEIVGEFLDWIALEVKRRRAGETSGKKVVGKTPPLETKTPSKGEKVEREFIRSLLLEPSFLNKVCNLIDEEVFSNPLLGSIFTKLKSLSSGYSRQVLLGILEEEEKKIVSELELEEKPPPTERVLYECTLEMLKLYLKRVGRINEKVLKLIKEGQFTKDKSLNALQSLLNKIYELI